jgi:hypothetical protein
MTTEPISPELALVDPDLAARARAALPERAAETRASRPAPQLTAPTTAAAPARAESARPYPLWARVTAALWLLALGIMIGGAAIPHAQDRPRVIPPDEDVPATICPAPQAPQTPQAPLGRPGSPFGTP